MTCCMMISSIIKKEIKLKKRSGFNVREGKMTTYWAKNTGVPGKKEQEAIKSRASIARKSYKTSSITIFPMVVWGPVNDQFTKSTDISSSENVAAMLNGKVFASALVIDHKGVLILRAVTTRQKYSGLWQINSVLI